MTAPRHAVETRRARRSSSLYARVEGTIEGSRSVAVVYRDGSVVGDRALLERVELVVALGEHFGEARLQASVGNDPLISTLSTARACDSVSLIDVYGPPGRRRAPEHEHGAPAHS